MIGVALCAWVVSAGAAAQKPDLLIIDGRAEPLAATPLQPALESDEALRERLKRYLPKKPCAEAARGKARRCRYRCFSRARADGEGRVVLGRAENAGRRGESHRLCQSRHRHRRGERREGEEVALYSSLTFADFTTPAQRARSSRT
jgi:hypothetical protein